MAMPIRPTDGLVHRLLQQQTRHNESTAQQADTKKMVEDKVNISHQARQESPKDTQQEQSYGYKQSDLESQLLRLYTHHNKTDTD